MAVVKRAPWRINVGLALGGGAARGLAHIGVIRGLQRAGIPIDIVTGTSMGAIVGGAFAAAGNVDQCEHQVREIVTSERFKKSRLSFLQESKKASGGLMYSVRSLVKKGVFYGVSSMRSSFLSAEDFASDIAAVVPDIPLADTQIPFAAVALDLDEGEEVLIRDGSLLRATRASSAIPGILPSVSFEGRTLIDGGWVDKVPVLPAFYLGADIVIAVDITADLDEPKEKRKAIDVMMRANTIRDKALVRMIVRLADQVIEPDVRSIHWADFGAVDRCVEAGEASVAEALPRLQAFLQKERWASLVRRSRARKMADHYLKLHRKHLCVL
ncbi:hypothetical protein ABI59_23735 [Acidobacteria bacterium Mor1]|nr:hypothetical protein ABI59_23735 [Acidobacteria bacterium Mor1]